MNPASSFRRLAPFALCGCLLGLPAVGSQAQQPASDRPETVRAAIPVPPPVDFNHEIARSVRETDGVRSVFTLRATQPRSSKLTSQKIRFIIEDTSLRGTFTRFINLNTGKHKTVAQMCAVLHDIFRRYQAGRVTANGALLGKVGDLKYGGEILFVAESPDHLRYDMKTSGEEDHSTRLTAADVDALAALLEQPPVAAAEPGGFSR